MNAPETRPAWFVLTQNWVSLVGVFLVTTAGISWLFVLPLQIRGHVDNPYIGIIVFLILPIIFFAGLALIPIGIYISRKRIRENSVSSDARCYLVMVFKDLMCCRFPLQRHIVFDFDIVDFVLVQESVENILHKNFVPLPTAIWGRAA